MTVELTYHWQANNRLVEPDDLRRIGQAVARALEGLAKGTKMPRGVKPPEPPFHMNSDWCWLRVPRQCNAKVNEDVVSIQADGNQGDATLLFTEPITVGRQRLEVTANLYRTSHRKCPLQRLVYFFKNGVFTGEIVEQKGELGSQNVVRWRGPTKRKKPADAARVAVSIRNWPGTITLGRPERQE
jgi:hypothetical protein